MIMHLGYSKCNNPNHKIETWKSKPQSLFIGYIKNLILYSIFEVVWQYLLTKNNIII